jgi:hypothetical protein
MLTEVTVLSPGPTGLSAVYGGRIRGRSVTVSGTSRSKDGFLGECVQALRGVIELTDATLTRCAGSAVEVSNSTVRLTGVDAEGGSAGCLIFIEGSQATIHGSRCFGRGPGLVAASASQARVSMNRWDVDPAFFVECAAGARVAVEYGEQVREPCTPSTAR